MPDGTEHQDRGLGKKQGRNNVFGMLSICVCNTWVEYIFILAQICIFKALQQSTRDKQ